MFFGEIQTELSEGALISASFILNDNLSKIKISKGKKIDKNIIRLLLNNNINTIMCAKLDQDDIDEDNSAYLISNSLINQTNSNLSVSIARQGRCNILADINGLLKYEPDQLFNINSVTDDVGIGAINQFKMVKKNQVIATTKIIPFAINKNIIEKIKEYSKDCFQVIPFINMNVHLIQTNNEKTLKKVLDKTLLVTQKRLQNCGITHLIEKRCDHDIKSLSKNVQQSVKEDADIILVFGASAICDKNDVVPSSLINNEGNIIRLGMPVEPGNLMLLGKINKSKKSIFFVGMPGCARSQKENGVDWILWRIFCGLDVSNNDINQMGTGGLL